MAHRLSCPAACGIIPDEGSNLCPLLWQEGSYPLNHQGSAQLASFGEASCQGGKAMWQGPEATSTRQWGIELLSLTTVASRWAPGLDSRCWSNRVKLELCSHLNTARTKLVARAEFCQSKEIRCAFLRSRKTSLSAHTQEGSQGVKKEGMPSHNRWCQASHRPLHWSPSW